MDGARGHLRWGRGSQWVRGFPPIPQRARNGWGTGNECAESVWKGESGEEFRGVFGEVGDDEVGAGAADAE